MQILSHKCMRVQRLILHDTQFNQAAWVGTNRPCGLVASCFDCRKDGMMAHRQAGIHDSMHSMKQQKRLEKHAPSFVTNMRPVDCTSNRPTVKSLGGTLGGRASFFRLLLIRSVTKSTANRGLFCSVSLALLEQIYPFGLFRAKYICFGCC